MTTNLFEGLETPRLILDLDRLEANAARMRQRCADLQVGLRPHLKTSKSVEVALVAQAGARGPVTVSTLTEAAHFARHGWRDILYATAIVPVKVPRLAAIQRQTGAVIHACIDDPSVVEALDAAARASESTLSILIEIDCGEHRSGLPLAPREIAALGQAVAASANLSLAGVITHAGHSYGTNARDQVVALACGERDAAVMARNALLESGLPCPIVSIGSTPTVLHADHLDGVTEVRAGIYMFWDLSQLSRGMCTQGDIALSVLASVIGHNRAGKSLVLDAGALALSKDVGAQRFLPEAGYGYVCDPATLTRLGALAVTGVHQEHANVAVDDEGWFARLPIGSLVRIVPNHACLTAAAHDRYEVVSAGQLIGHWPRINGWT